MNRKVARLLKEYQFLSELLRRFRGDYLGDPDKIRVCHIRVAKATPDIVCYIAQRSDIMAFETRLKDLQGTCWEEIWAYGHGNDDEEWIQGVFSPYFKDEITEFLKKEGFSTEYLVKLRYEIWHRPENKQDIVECQVYLTLYKIPADGLSELLASSDPAANVYMTSGRLMDSLFNSAKGDYEKAYQALKDIGERFNDEVYENGLREYLNDVGTATKGTYDGIVMLSTFTCGRCLINLDLGDRYVAFVAEDTPGKKMSYMGHAGSVDEIRNITEKVIKCWGGLTPAERETVQKSDAHVSFLGL